MKMILIASIPIAWVWLGITGQVSIGGFLVGYLIAIAILILLKSIGLSSRHALQVSQPLAILTYLGVILWDGLISSFQVVGMVLKPNLQLRTGIIALPTGDRSREQQLAALSAHGINMAPGQLVIDFDDNGNLYIHCLDLEASRATLETDQARRIKLLRRILGIQGEALAPSAPDGESTNPPTPITITENLQFDDYLPIQAKTSDTEDQDDQEAKQ